MQIEAMRLDDHLVRDLDRGAAADHRIREHARMQKFENLAVNIA